MRTWVDWMPRITFWVEDGQRDPNVDWPENWDVCGWPDRNPMTTESEDRRHGNTTLAMPMYHVHDPLAELDRICSFLERTAQTELEKWPALQDRQLQISCGEPEMDAADVDARGFKIPGTLIQRIRNLRIQLTIGFHPAAEVIFGGIYGTEFARSRRRVPMRTSVDWRPQLVYWLLEGKPNPDVEWPDDWELCRYPHQNPLVYRDTDRRPGNLA